MSSVEAKKNRKTGKTKCRGNKRSEKSFDFIYVHLFLNTKKKERVKVGWLEQSKLDIELLQTSKFQSMRNGRDALKNCILFKRLF